MGLIKPHLARGALNNEAVAIHPNPNPTALALASKREKSLLYDFFAMTLVALCLSATFLDSLPVFRVLMATDKARRSLEDYSRC